MLLLIDTSRPEALMALVDDDVVLVKRQWQADKTLGRQLLQNIEGALGEAAVQRDSIKRIAVQQGPGHYSALRTGIVTAQSLSLAWGVSLVAVTGHDFEDMVKQAWKVDPVVAITPRYT